MPVDLIHRKNQQGSYSTKIFSPLAAHLIPCPPTVGFHTLSAIVAKATQDDANGWQRREELRDEIVDETAAAEILAELLILSEPGSRWSSRFSSLSRADPAPGPASGVAVDSVGRMNASVRVV